MLYWFDEVFPGFTGPAGASAEDLFAIKSLLYVWILHFGASVMMQSDWDDLKSALLASDWSNYLAWVGSTPGYLTDGTSASVKPFPAQLLVGSMARAAVLG